MYDLISIGTLTIDLFFKSDSLTMKGDRFELAIGGKYFTNHFQECLGGGATNVAIGAQRHGLRTSLKTVIGENSFKKMIIEKLHENCVSYLHSTFEKDHFNISCILLSPSGERTVINYQSPHQHLFKTEDEYLSLLRADTVYVGNIPDISYFNKLKILSFLHKHKKKIVMNMGVVDCRRTKEQLKELLSYVDILIVNGHEFADIVKVPYERLHFNDAYIPNLLPVDKGTFEPKMLIITEGDKGSFGYTQKQLYYQKPIEPEIIVDSTGAGDGYSAGFVSAIIKKQSVQEAMLWGAQYASTILAKLGAN